MREQDLMAAIGDIDDIYLLELEQPNIRRLPKHFGLIAAILTLMLTACAAPVILQNFTALQNGGIVDNEHTITWAELWENPEEHIVNGNYIILHPNTVALEVTVSEDAPETLVQPCLPLTLLDYASIETCTISETQLSLTLSTKVPQYGQIRGILYQQRILPENGHIEVDSFVGPGLWNEGMKTYGSISVLEIDGNTSYEQTASEPALEQPSYTGHIYTKHIFWSDGNYLYCLKLPITYSLPVTAVEDIVTSLTAVEDITQYLPAE